MDTYLEMQVSDLMGWVTSPRSVIFLIESMNAFSEEWDNMRIERGYEIRLNSA